MRVAGGPRSDARGVPERPDRAPNGPGTAATTGAGNSSGFPVGES